MPRLLRFVRLAAIAVLPVYASCSSDGGTITVHHSMTNYDGCVEAYVYLDLEAAHSVLARTELGGPDCALEPARVADGCTMTLSESDDGGTLGVAVKGCAVGIDLFSCRYTSADLESLNDAANGDCGCLTRPSSCYINGVCDLCASAGDNREGCENCQNEIDDDLDGELDCDDDDCWLDEDCGFGRTTITCSSTTTTVSLTTSTLDVALGATPELEMTFLNGD